MSERIVDWPDLGLKITIPLYDVEEKLATIRKQLTEHGYMIIPNGWTFDWYPIKGEDDGQ